jgi:hypothetical protein
MLQVLGVRTATRDGGSETIEVNGRVAAMVGWLVARRVQIEEMPKVRIVFHCAGWKSVSPTLEICEDAVRIEQ